MEASTPNVKGNPAPVAAAALESRGGSRSAPPPAQPPQPVPIPSVNAPPPFLVKTYEMVDDPSTDKIVSWSSTNNSVVIWDQPEFTRSLLPKYFKHSNYSSFVRQLNTYGFRKVDPDRQEFANEGFLRGQKHLLKTISRKKGAHGNIPQPQPQPQPPQGENTSVGPCIEVGKFGLEEEVERLKRDKNVLMQELVRLRQQQQATDNQLQTMVQHLQGMEQRQQQMMSFLAKAVNSPGFLAQFVQQQNDSSRRITERSKKRRLKQDDGLADQTVAATDGQIVKYQPMINEAAKAMLRQLMKVDTSPRLDNFLNTSDNFLISNGSASKQTDCEITNHLTTVSLQDIPPTSVHSSLPLPSQISFQNSSTYSSDIQPPLFGGATSEISDVNPLVGAQSTPPVDLSRPDIIMPKQISHLSGMSPEGDDDILGAEQENGAFLDTSSSDVNGISTLDSDDIAYDWEGMADLPSSSDPFWENFLLSPSRAFETEEMDSSSVHEEDLQKGVDSKPQVNGWDQTQNLEQVTTQMRNLA